MLTTHTITSLYQLIASAFDQVQQLLQLLEKEQQALLSEDHETFENIIEQKIQLSQSLDNIEIQRQQIMANAGHNIDSNSMQRFLLDNQDNSSFKPLTKLWGSLLSSLKKAADQNMLNGILVEKQRQHVQHALTILFEQSNSPPVYDAAGGTSKPEYSRSVGVA